MKRKKTKRSYRLRNWREYNPALGRRGSLSLWLSPEVLASWRSHQRTGRRGRPQTYTSAAILCMATLNEIMVIAILAVICGAEHFTEMEAFGEATEDWLKTFLTLETGIPSHDTFARVFALISPTAFSERFVQWMQAARTATEVVPEKGSKYWKGR